MAYKSSFSGILAAKEGNTTGGRTSYRSSFSGIMSSRRKRREDEQGEIDYAEELKRESTRPTTTEEKPKDTRSNFQRIRDLAKGAASAVTEGADRVADATAELILDKTGSNAREQEQYDKNHDESLKRLLDAKTKSKDKSLSEEKRQRWARLADSISSDMTSSYKEREETINKSIEKMDPVKAGAGLVETGFDILTLGAGGAALKGVKAGGKVLARKTAETAAAGAGSGAINAVTRGGKDTSIKDVAKGAAIGGVAGGIFPVGGVFLRKTDKAVGRIVSGALDSGGRSGLRQLGEDGVVGTLNKMVSRAGRKATYVASDVASKTKVGRKAISLKDDFMTKWVGELHPLYKTLKRSDFEGKTDGAYLAAREAIGNSNRALSYANDFVEDSEGMTKVAAGIEAKSPTNLVKGKADFDKYAKVRSEMDLLDAGKKKFSAKKVKSLEERAAKVKDFEKEYDGLVQFYKETNDFRLENGLISKEQWQKFNDEPFDYVRQQRELPEWMLDKPATSGRGSVASITKSQGIQKRNKYASAELLSPTETAIKTAQLAHVEAYRNKAAKTLYGLLDEAGEAKLVRSTDMVRDKQALLKDLAQSKPVVNKMNRMVRRNKNAVRALEKEITQLKKKGRGELTKEMNSFVKRLQKKASGDPTGLVRARSTIEEFMALDNKELRKVRKMIEGRNTKLEPLMDKIELLNRDLDDLYKERSATWQAANKIKTTVDKGGMTSLSFLDDGVENVVKIDPVIASAVHNWDKQQQNVMNAFLRLTNNAFKYGTTGANVGFALPNFVADQLGSAVNSKSLIATHNPRNFIHSFMMSIGKPLNSEDGEILRKYLAGNKGQLSINQYTKKAAADKISNRIIRQTASRKAKAFTMLKNNKEARRALFDGMENMVGLTEDLTRIQNYRGTFLKAGKKGLQAERLANQAARENSIDFLEMGSYGRVVNSFIPYFNASIQGSRTMLRNIAERPVSTAAKLTALVGMPTAATTVWNTSDETRAAIYATIPEYLKEGNFVLISPAAHWNEEKKKWDGVYMMKKPPGMSEFAEPVRKFIEYQTANNPDAKKGLAGFLQEEGGDIAGDMVNSVSPVDFSSPDKFLSSVTPQILKPTAEAIVNRNFFTGKNIVPDSMSDLPAEDQKYENYSQLTSWIGGMFNTSPLKVDQWIKQTFGEVGTNAQYYTDRLTGAPEEAQGGRSLSESITRRFAGAQGGADTDAFYKAYTPASNNRRQTSKQITELVKQNRLNEARRKAEEFNETITNRFETFMRSYGNSPNYKEDWDEMINNLRIPTTERAFSVRKSQ
jgi:hypothetical protein